MVVAKEKEKDKQDISQNNETKISHRAFGGKDTRSQTLTWQERQNYFFVRVFRTRLGEYISCVLDVYL